MKTVLKSCVVVAFTAFSSLAADNSKAPKLSSGDYYIDYKLFETVASNLVMSLEFASKSDEVMDQMLSDGKDRLAVAFTAAKIAWLRDNPSKAIGILEDMIRNYGKEKSGQQFNLPVNILCNYWIATIARQYGDAERAQKAYDDIIKHINGDEALTGQAIYCYLYKAELESVMLKRQDLALETLRKIKQMHSSFGQGQDELWSVFQEWADYQMAVQKQGVLTSQSALKSNPFKTTFLMIVADAELFIQGVTASPRSDFYAGQRLLLKFHGLQQAIENENSPIYKCLAQCLTGYMYESCKQSTKAERYYTDLFNGGSFFAPEGGILLASCQKKQGKIEESKKTYSKVKERFPGYSSLVDELSKK